MLGLVVMVAELLLVLGLERNGVVGDVKHGKRVIRPFLFLQALGWRVERRKGLFFFKP